MTLRSSTIRPGLLVALKTSIRGNVRYVKTVIQDETEDGSELVARWETERRIADAAEHKLASQVRSKARSLITGVCSHSGFGLLCPDSRTGELEYALEKARQLTDDFNANAKVSSITVNVITGRIAADDVEAVKSINSEVRDLLSLMESGIQRLDVGAVRDAADRARSVSQMLSPAAQERVSVAIDTARAAARKIVKAGETLAKEIDSQAIQALARTRAAFLDFDEAGEIVIPAAEARGVDFAPEEVAAPADTPQAPHAAPQIEI